jgi:hypothetical protein
VRVLREKTIRQESAPVVGRLLRRMSGLSQGAAMQTGTCAESAPFEARISMESWLLGGPFLHAGSA